MGGKGTTTRLQPPAELVAVRRQTETSMNALIMAVLMLISVASQTSVSKSEDQAFLMVLVEKPAGSEATAEVTLSLYTLTGADRIDQSLKLVETQTLHDARGQGFRVHEGVYVVEVSSAGCRPARVWGVKLKKGKAASVHVALERAHAPDAPTLDVISTDTARVVNESGWEIPGLAGAQVSHPRKRYHRPPDDLFITGLTPPDRNSAAKLIDVTSQNPDSLLIRESCWTVMRMEALDINSNVFCYLVYLGGLRDCTNQKQGVLAIAIEYQYYDMDGDGRFETREWGIQFLPTFDPPIPDWVRTKRH